MTGARRAGDQLTAHRLSRHITQIHPEAVLIPLAWEAAARAGDRFGVVAATTRRVQAQTPPEAP